MSLSDAYTIGVDWTYSQALGWIRLSVPEKDVESAVELLKADFSAQIVETGEEPAETCPSCGSEELVLEKGSRKTVALMILTYVPFVFWRSRLKCRTCGWSRRVPIRFRPELAAMILAGAMTGVIAAAAAVATLALVFQFARRIRGPY